MDETATPVTERPAQELRALESGMQHPVVLFDGVCNLCDSSVQFMIARDPESHLRFVSLQSARGQRILRRFNLPTENFGSVVLIENDRFYQHSTAALRITRHLNGGWRVFSLLLVIPSVVRDVVYDLIAANRYRWFGKKDLCMMPTPELRARFLT